MIELINTHIDLPSLSSEFARLTESQIALIADPCFGRLASRPRLPFRAESVVLMTPRNTRAIGLQPCESMVCKFPITRVKASIPACTHCGTPQTGHSAWILRSSSQGSLGSTACAAMHRATDTSEGSSRVR
jgi:hypothetical protein